MDRSEGTLLSHLPEHGRAVHGTAQLSAPATPLGALVAPLVAHRLPIRRMLMPAGIVGDPRASLESLPAQVADRDLPPTDADIETDAQGRFRFTVRRLSGMSKISYSSHGLRSNSTPWSIDPYEHAARIAAVSDGVTRALEPDMGVSPARQVPEKLPRFDTHPVLVRGHLARGSIRSSGCSQRVIATLP